MIPKTYSYYNYYTAQDLWLNLVINCLESTLSVCEQNISWIMEHILMKSLDNWKKNIFFNG